MTILHGGQHEYEFAVPGVRHIHEDPHFAETLERGLGDETFELVVAQYGRLRMIADVLPDAPGGSSRSAARPASSRPTRTRAGARGKPALHPDT